MDITRGATMAIEHDVTKINLSITSIEPFSNNSLNGFVIHWSSNIGFGEYTIYNVNGSDGWYADSEYMDTNADKAFITELMRLFIEELTIEH